MSVEPLLEKIGKYVELEEIGSGGMGVVYRALDPTLNRAVAIKMLKRANAGSEVAQFAKFFSRELVATASLQHRNIVTVYESGEQDGSPYLVMEFLQGKPLSRIIEERSAMPLSEKLGIVVQVCDGIQYAHNRIPQIIHRDVKPANVILLFDGVAKIVDFGIARVVGSESTIIQTGQLLGSLPYMSPEQVNSLPVDLRTDIYSIGVLLYQFLTYSLPFKGADTGATLSKILREDPAPLSNFLQDIPPGLQECLTRVLAKDPEARHQSAEELGFDLLQIQKKIRDRATATLMQHAEAAMKRGDLQKASLHLQEIIRLDRQHEQANRSLAEVRKTLLSQQKTARIMQLLSQARVALNGRQFDQAREYVDHALQLSPRHGESIALSNQISQAAAQAKSAEELLKRAEAALQAGDLDQASHAIHSVLIADPTNLEARSLQILVEKQIAENELRSEAQHLLDRAHNAISCHRYQEAKDFLARAQQLDPSDSRAADLLAWANRGQQQQLHRNQLEELTQRVDEALRADDLIAADQICDAGLEHFPAEAALLRLKSIVKDLQYANEKRRYIQDQLFAARRFADGANFERAIELLTTALGRFPAEPTLTAALLDVRSQVELRQRITLEANARSKQRLTAAGSSLRRALDEQDSIQRIEQLAAPLKESLPDPSFSEDLKYLLKEVSRRRDLLDQAQRRLDSILATMQNRPDAPIAEQIADEVRSIQEVFPKEAGIQENCSHLLHLVETRRAESQRRVSETTALEAGGASSQATPIAPIPLPAYSSATTVVFDAPLRHELNLLPAEKPRVSFLAGILAIASISLIVFAGFYFFNRSSAPAVTSPPPNLSSSVTDAGPPTAPDASVAKVTSITGDPPPTLTALSQATIPAGSPGVLLTLSGSGFVDGKTHILWNGSPRRARVLSENTMTAELTTADIALPKTASIAVQTPSGRSGPLPFNVAGVLPPPRIVSLSPSSIPAGSSDFTLTVAMAGIIPGKTRLLWNGVPQRDTVRGNQTNLIISAHNVTSPGEIPVTISNPPYDAASSSTLKFSVDRPIQKIALIPAGTVLSINPDKPPNSSTSHTGEPLNAILSKDIVVDGVTVIKAGSPLRGSVKFAKAKNFLRAGLLVVTFSSINVNGVDHAIRSGSIEAGAGQKTSPQKASDYFSSLDNSVYPEKDSLKDFAQNRGGNLRRHDF